MSNEAPIFDRAVAQLLAAQRHVRLHAEGYTDREDLVATQLLLKTLRMIIEDALREIIRIQREIATPPDLTKVARTRYLNSVRSIARRTTALVGQPLHYVVSAHGREFDPIAVAYARMAREIEPNTEIIFRGSERRSYALSAPLLGPLRSNLVNRSSPFVAQLDQLPTILFVQYPAAAEGDVLQHLLVAHEVAHLALRRLRAGDVTEAEARFAAAVEAYRAIHPEWHATATDDQEQSRGAADPSERRRQRDRAIRWFVELACDVLAVRLVGPAYCLALYEHALIRQWFYGSSDPDSETHPHLAWRLKQAATQLPYFTDVMTPSLAEALGTYIAEVPDSRDQIAAEGDWGQVIGLALEALAADVGHDPQQLLGDAPLDRELLAAELEPVLAGLRRGMAPAEQLLWTERDVSAWTDDDGHLAPAWSSPRDWRSILTAGYLYVLDSADADRPVPPLRGRWQACDESRRSIVGHLRGTVELTEFQRRAAAAIDHLGTLEESTP